MDPFENYRRYLDKKSAQTSSSYLFMLGPIKKGSYRIYMYYVIAVFFPSAVPYSVLSYLPFAGMAKFISERNYNDYLYLTALHKGELALYYLNGIFIQYILSICAFFIFSYRYISKGNFLMPDIGLGDSIYMVICGIAPLSIIFYYLFFATEAPSGDGSGFYDRPGRSILFMPFPANRLVLIFTGLLNVFSLALFCYLMVVFVSFLCGKRTRDRMS